MHCRPRPEGSSLPAFVLQSLPLLKTSKRTNELSTCGQPARARWLCAGALPPVIFVLGGPGSGKGTQCSRLSTEFDLAQVCVGDLLRRVAKSGSAVGHEVAKTIRRGGIVPGEVTIGLLRDALLERASFGGVLVDGFPRAMDQALLFEAAVTECEFVLFFKCDVEEMVSRLLKRGATSGREDDDASVVEKRLQTYMKKTMPVVEYYRKKGLLREVDSNIGNADDVYKITRPLFEHALLF